MVDWPTNCIPNKKWRWKQVVHLFGDDLDELHRVAQAIGMKRNWFQLGESGKFPHYDLTPRKRQAAIDAGAIELTRKTFRDAWKRTVTAYRHLAERAIMWNKILERETE